MTDTGTLSATDGAPRWPSTPDLEILAATRVALHRLASTVIAPTRHRSTGRFGLIATPGGFGTPRFSQAGSTQSDSTEGGSAGSATSGRQIRVEGTQLVDDVDGAVRSAAITTLREAAAFLDATVDPDTAREHDSPEVGDVDEVLAVDGRSSDFLGAWYSMAFEALTRVGSSDAAIEPSPPQLWPGHFDPAIESGTEATRASYGASPGDDAIPEPYLYVALWYPDQAGIDAGDPFWNASSFTGRILRLADFADAGLPATDPSADDAVAVAERFWLEVAERLG